MKNWLSYTQSSRVHMCVCLCVSASVCLCVWVGFSFRCVGFRIYAFPILDDISYFCADSAGEKPSLLMMMMMMRLYYCFFMAFAYTCMHNINVCGLLHWLSPPPLLLLHMCAFSVSVCLGDYQLIVLRICLADFSFYLSVCLFCCLAVPSLSHSSVEPFSHFICPSLVAL